MRFWVVLISVGAWANWNDTSTGVDLAKLAHPALVRVAELDGLTRSRNETVLRGMGKAGRRWTVHLCDTCADEIYRGDLDGNGIVDYAIVGVGPFGDTRTSPQYSITLLLMDSNGVPVPFFSPLYHGEKGEALRHLVLLDGKVRLLISRYDEIPSDAGVGPYCSGHWVTQAYGFNDTVVQEVRGVFEGMRFPLVKNWAYSHPECANHPVGFSEAAKIVTSAKDPLIVRLKAVDENASKIEIEKAGECEAVLADAVVFDLPAGREVELPNLDGQRKLAERMRVAGAAVELRGLRDCTAAAVWGVLQK